MYELDKQLCQDLYSIYLEKESRNIAENLKKEDAELILNALNLDIAKICQEAYKQGRFDEEMDHRQYAIRQNAILKELHQLLDA